MSPEHSALPGPHHPILNKSAVRNALRCLLDAYEYAADLGVHAWDFAVEIETLLAADSTVNALRWLEERGITEYRAPRGDGQSVRRPPASETGSSFPKGARFVLTDSGARLLQKDGAAREDAPAARKSRPEAEGMWPTPVWDREAGVLHYQGKVVKKFRNMASNQRRILDEFTLQGWPAEIADPLPSDRAVCSKERLRDTVKNLNRDHQEGDLLGFYTTDSGHGIGWRRVGYDPAELPG